MRRGGRGERLRDRLLDLRRRNWLLYYGIVAGAHIVAFTIVGLLTRDWSKFFIYLAGFAVVMGVIMTIRAVRKRRHGK